MSYETEERNERTGRVVMRLVGGILIAMGALLAVTCGYITFTMWSTCANTPGEAGPFAFIGGVPTVIGVMMLIAGVILIVIARPPPKGPPKDLQ